MPVAPWQWLVAGTAAVAAHGAIGLALLGEPVGGGGSGGGTVSVSLTLGAGDAVTEAVRAYRRETAEAAARPAAAAELPEVKADPVETARTPTPAVPMPPLEKTTAPAAATDREPAVAVREKTAPPAAPEAPPPLPLPRPAAAAGAADDGSGDDAAGNAEPAARGAAADSRTAAPGNASAAGEVGEGGPAHDARAGYIAELQAWLQRHKRYPQHAIARRQQGTATLHFVVDRAGRVLDYRLEQSSGHRLLDREALEMIERAAPLPQMPASLAGANLAVVLPVRFALR